MNSFGRLMVVGACIIATGVTGSVSNATAASPSEGSRTSATTAAPRTYFISPDGSDTNPGTKGAPFKSLMRAQAAASAGDVVYIRGGTYREFEVSETDNPHESVYHYVHDIYKSGVTYAAFPGDERPVFDFSAVPTDQRVAAFYIGKETTGTTFIGFDVTGVKVGDQKQSEVFRISGGADFINMAAYGNAASGFYYLDEGTGFVVNSDAYDNIGPTPLSAGNIDGFGAHGRDVWFINTRAWNNSDDGFDSISSTGRVTIVNSWAFDHNGNQDGRGDKNGFKVGGYAYRTTGLPDPIPVHTVIGSLAVGNGGNNFYANHQPGQAAYWINNTADDPGYGANFNMLERLSPTSPQDVPGFREVLHHNIAFTGPTTSNDNNPAENATNNSWTIDGGLAVTAADFTSLDQRQLTAPRNPDGSLPEVTFLKPVETSPLHEYGLGYLADADDPFATVEKLVNVYAHSGDVDNHGVADGLREKLQAQDLGAFLRAVEAQSGKHVSPYAARSLTLVAEALISG